MGLLGETERRKTSVSVLHQGPGTRNSWTTGSVSSPKRPVEEPGPGRLRSADGLAGLLFIQPRGTAPGVPTCAPRPPFPGTACQQDPVSVFPAWLPRSSASGPGHHTCPLTTYIKGSEAKHWTDDVGQRAPGRAGELLRRKRVLAFPPQKEGTRSVILTKKPPEGQKSEQGSILIFTHLWSRAGVSPRLHPPRPTGIGHPHDTARVPCPYWKEG